MRRLGAYGLAITTALLLGQAGAEPRLRKLRPAPKRTKPQTSTLPRVTPDAGVVPIEPVPPERAQTQPTPDAGVPQAGATKLDDGFSQRTRAVEVQVAELKERVFHTKARLLLLQETVLGTDAAAGARVVLFHRNEMSSSFALESATYVLDGATLFDKTDPRTLDARQELEIFNGHLPPGQHQLTVKLVYRGHGYGVFSYLEGYRFKVQSTHSFAATAGKVTSIKVVGFEKEGTSSELKDRPAIRYDVQTRDTTPNATVQAP